MKTASGLYRAMLRIRRFEEMASDHFHSGDIPGVVHLSIGQEAISAGVGCALQKGDRSTTTHRGHGDMIAVGADVRRMFAELLARTTGFCGAKGGSMHIADISAGVLGANGIVGGGLPIAVGSGLTSLLLKDGAVTVAFFGDGAVNAGSFHESLNLASSWKLPVIFVCHNNQYGQFSRSDVLTAATSIADRAAAYGIPSVHVDGSDVMAVHEVACKFVDAARSGKGPQFIEGRCYRYRGHVEGDLVFLGGQNYRTDEEIATHMARDPLTALIRSGFVSRQEAETILENVNAELKEAFTWAMEQPRPTAEDALIKTLPVGVS